MQHIPHRSAALTGGHKLGNHTAMLKEGVDIAVCTPGRLSQLLVDRHLFLDDAKVRPAAAATLTIGSQSAMNTHFACHSSLRTCMCRATGW